MKFEHKHENKHDSKNSLHNKEHGTKDSKQDTELKNLKKESNEHKESLQRIQAEFENFQKRNERERIEFIKFASARTIEEFLPLVDSISEGINQAKKSNNPEMIEGFEKIKSQLLKIFEKQGVKPINSVGEKFDHNFHECMMTANEKDKKDDYILEEFQKGYVLKDKILRPAKVKVNKKE